MSAGPQPTSGIERTPEGGWRGWTTTFYEIPPEVIPNLDEQVIEDDEPVDNIFAEKQQRLLARTLYSSWQGPGEGRSFQVFANVGLLFRDKQPGLAPDVMLATDIPTGGDLTLRENRSYFIWERGKPPDVAIELVSDRRGREEDFKLEQYARIGVPFYAIFDPTERLGKGVLRAFANHAGLYQALGEPWFPLVGLGLVLWQGTYEGHTTTWLRWCDPERRIIPTGQERAEQEKQRAEQEKQRAEQEKQRAEQMGQQLDQERHTRERLDAKLHALGIDPKSV
jgi:hypothetical protein